LDSVAEFEATTKTANQNQSKRIIFTSIQLVFYLGVLIVLAYIFLVHLKLLPREYIGVVNATIISECSARPTKSGHKRLPLLCRVKTEEGQIFTISIDRLHNPKNGKTVSLKRYSTKKLFGEIYQHEVIAVLD